MANNKKDTAKVSVYVEEIKNNEVLCETLKTLNGYRKSLLNECKNDEVVTARKEMEAARSKYNKLATAYVLGDTSYCNLQTECVRAAVSEFSHTHNVPRFFQWFNDNGKDEQNEVIDSEQRLGSKVAALHASFASGSKVAKEVAMTETERQEKIADLQAQLKALQAAG